MADVTSSRERWLSTAVAAVVGAIAGYALAATWAVRLTPWDDVFAAMAFTDTGPRLRYLRLIAPCVLCAAAMAVAAARARTTALDRDRPVSWRRALTVSAPWLLTPFALTQDDLVRRDALLAALLGIAAALGASLVLPFADEPDATIAKSRARTLAGHAPVVFGLIAHAALFSWLTIRRDLAVWSATVDLGIFKEALWNTLHGRAMFSPTVGYSFFGEHFSPVLYALVPLYALWPHSATLLCVQAGAVSLAGWPIYRLALAHRLGRTTATVLALSMVFAPSMQLAMMYDFHMDLLGVPALAWALLAAHKRRWIALAIASAVLCSVKEDAFIPLAGVALYLFVDDPRRRIRAPLTLFLVSTAWCALAIAVLIRHFGPPPGVPTYMGGAVTGYKFMRNFHHLEGPHGPVGALLNSPARFVLWVLSGDRLTTVCTLWAPLLFAPLFAGRRAVVMLPLFVVLLSDNVDINRLHYHYGAMQHPAVYAAGIVGLARLLEAARRRGFTGTHRAVAIGVASASVLLALVHPSSEACALGERDVCHITGHARASARIAAEVPADAPISATSFGGARFSNRSQSWMFPHGLDQARYALVDLQRPSWPATGSERDDAVLSALRPGGGWGVVDFEDGVVLMDHDASNERNREAVRALFVRRMYDVEGTEWTDYPRRTERDETSQAGWVRVYRPGDPRAGAFLVFGPFARVPAGPMRVHFRLRAEQIVGDIGRVDAFDNGAVLGERTLLREDFPDAGWQDIALDFEGGGRARVEFRVRTDHGSVLAVDRIALEPLAGDDAALSSMGF